MSCDLIVLFGRKIAMSMSFTRLGWMGAWVERGVALQMKEV